MQVRRIGYRVKGLYRVAGLGMKWGIIAPNTEKRLKILRFWEEHGLKATIAAFGARCLTGSTGSRRKARGVRPPVPRVQAALLGVLPNPPLTYDQVVLMKQTLSAPGPRPSPISG